MADAVRVLGVDPGVASTGVVAISDEGEGMQTDVVRVVRTKKASKKALRDLRISADDIRRLREIWDAVRAVAEEHPPHAMGIEAYAPRPGAGGGNAWKTAMVYGLLVGLGFALDRPVLPFLPTDLKRKIAKQANASKEAVAEVLYSEVKDLRALVEEHAPGTQAEHATDAAGHAVLALREVVQMRRMMGGEP